MIFHQQIMKSVFEQKQKKATGSKFHKISQYGYSQDDLIGRGKFSLVYKGIYFKTNQLVAIKVMPVFETNVVTSKKYIFSQISILKSLEHPNIVKYYDAFELDLKWFLIMQFCDEGDLTTKLVKMTSYNDSQNKKIINQVFNGLCYLNHLNIIHRDIKLSNIVIKRGIAKIADFGFAIRSSILFKDIKIGSPLYMSPEAFIHHLYGPKTDVWSFGVMIYQMIYKINPFEACKSEEQLKIMITKQFGDSIFQPRCSAQLQQIILRCLTVQLQNRPTFAQLNQLMFFVSEKSKKEELDSSFTKAVRIPQSAQYVVKICEGNKQQNVSSTMSIGSGMNQPMYHNVENEGYVDDVYQGKVNFQMVASMHGVKKQIISYEMLFCQMQVGQVECIFFIQYVRLIYKCYSLMRYYRFRQQCQLYLLKNWILFILKGLYYYFCNVRINNRYKKVCKISKMVYVVQEYLLRYQKQFGQKQGVISQIYSNQLTFEKLGGYFQEIYNRLMFHIRQNMEQKFVILGHYILMGSVITKLIGQCHKRRSYKLESISKELNDFFQLKNHQMNRDTLFQLNQRYKYKIQ